MRRPIVDSRSVFRRSLRLIFNFFFLFFIPFVLCSSQRTPEGFKYTHLKFDGPLSVHILEVDPHFATIQAVRAGNDTFGLEKTSSIAARYGAFAAVNGGFFRMSGAYEGTSSGVFKINGEWLSSPRNNRAAIGWKNGGKSVLIDRLSLNSKIAFNGMTFQIDGINQPKLPSQNILYTSRIGSSTRTESNGIELQIDQNLTLLHFSRSENSPIPSKGFVFSVSPPFPCDFCESSIGAKIHFSFIPVPILEPSNASKWADMQFIVGGTPVLILNGEIITDYSAEKVLSSFLQKKHDRTAIGILPNGNWVFVVVDGRQPFWSLGLNMIELANLMHSLGCTYALNLDGGGSSTLYLNGKVRNSPSGDDEDGPIPLRGERKVSDVILIHLKTI